MKISKWATLILGITLSSNAVNAQTNPLWTQQKVKNYLPHMTVPEVRQLLTQSDMVVIPITALEQHGLHLPIGTDFLNGLERVKMIAQRTDVLVAPIQVLVWMAASAHSG